MEFEFPLPISMDEWLAWWTALLTLLVGLALMVIPRRFARFLGLKPVEGSQNGVSEVRGAFGGMWVGVALVALLLAQPWLYLALGAGFAFAVLGRLISFVADRSFGGHCAAATVIEGLGAYFCLSFAGSNLGLF